MPSSPINIAGRQPSLMQVLSTVPGPRCARGMRHRLEVILAVAVGAVLSGARSLLAIGQWAAGLDAEARTRLGLPASARLPEETTIRRVLSSVDGAALDAAVGAWMWSRTAATVAGRRVLAVDGKTMRATATHLLAVLDHATGAVVAQQEVGPKTNEIPALRDMIDDLVARLPGLDGAVTTADAMHTQRATAEAITARGGHWVLTVKANQPRLLAQLKALPWKDTPATTAAERSHGRYVRRTIKALQAPQWIDFPNAAQVLQIRRTRTTRTKDASNKRTTETVYAICSLDMIAAPPDHVAAWIQGHWGIENRLHWVRDVTFDEDRHQLPTTTTARAMATLTNTAISLIRLTSPDHPSRQRRKSSIAPTCRYWATHPHQTLQQLTQQPTP